MGVPVAGSEMVNLLQPSPKYFVGSGKAEMIKQAALANEANLIIIDDELTPAQQNNWEKLTGEAVIELLRVHGQTMLAASPAESCHFLPAEGLRAARPAAESAGPAAADAAPSAPARWKHPTPAELPETRAMCWTRAAAARSLCQACHQLPAATG